MIFFYAYAQIIYSSINQKFDKVYNQFNQIPLADIIFSFDKLPNILQKKTSSRQRIFRRNVIFERETTSSCVTRNFFAGIRVCKGVVLQN